MLKHFMDVRRKGSIAPHYNLQEVQSREISKVKIPEGCTALRFLDKEETIVEGHHIFGHSKNISCWYYFGEEVSLENAKEKISPEKYLRLCFGGYQRVAITKSGEVIGLNAEDVVLPA